MQMRRVSLLHCDWGQAQQQDVWLVPDAFIACSGNKPALARFWHPQFFTAGQTSQFGQVAVFPGGLSATSCFGVSKARRRGCLMDRIYH